MRDCIDIGPTPCEEDCQQLGANDYTPQRAKIECRNFIDAIRRKLGDEVGSARLSIKGNSHDFGTYYEVVCYYDDEDNEGQDYAYRCESDAPKTWAEVGMLPPCFIETVCA